MRLLRCPWKTSLPTSLCLLAITTAPPSFAQTTGAVPAAAVIQPPSGAAIGAALLQRANEYRRMAGLAPLTVDPERSKAAEAHARYITVNHLTDDSPISSPISAGWAVSIFGVEQKLHHEQRDKPGYTPDGAALAPVSLVVQADSVASARKLADTAMTLPILSLFILQPQIAECAVGTACSGEMCTVVFGPDYGLDKSLWLSLYHPGQGDLQYNDRLGKMPAHPGRLKVPIYFPPRGSTIGMLSDEVSELLDVLSACPGYSRPTGLPISLQLGMGEGQDSQIRTTAHSLMRDGNKIESCLVSSSSEFEPRKKDDWLPRRISSALWFVGDVILIPRAPLLPGSTYSVSISADSHDYQWSFNTAPAATASAPP